jgi:hypothetical protein
MKAQKTLIKIVRDYGNGKIDKETLYLKLGKLRDKLQRERDEKYLYLKVLPFFKKSLQKLF